MVVGSTVGASHEYRLLEPRQGGRREGFSVSRGTTVVVVVVVVVVIVAAVVVVVVVVVVEACSVEAGSMGMRQRRGQLWWW
jgi:hypothetical protein